MLCFVLCSALAVASVVSFGNDLENAKKRQIFFFPTGY
jgi:hypothetical protein